MISEIRFYLTLFWRRLPLFLLIFVPIVAVSVLLAISLPPVYRAQMRLVVESSQIPGNLAQSTVDTPAEEQLQMFQTRLMTRDNLLDIATRLRPFRDQSSMSGDQIVQAMRAATTIRSTSGRGQATLMTVGFDSQYPAMTVRVLDAYLTFILNEDAQYRSQRAGQTQEFFQQEVDRLSTALSEQGAKIIAFKNQNADSLPDSLQYHRDLLISMQDRVTQNDRDRASLEEQKQRLQQAYELTGRVTGTGAQLSPQEQRIQQLRNQLAEVESIYSPDSPRVTTLKRRIEQLEASFAASSGQQNPTEAQDPGKALLDVQTADIDAKLAQLAEDRTRLQDQITEVQARVDRTPGNAVALESLQRDYENIQNQYNRAADSLSRASTGERIETLSRGQRVSVVERASEPSAPIKPNRKQLVALGILAGLAVAMGVLLVLDLLSGKIQRSKDLISGLGITPMVTIPLMRSEAEIRAVWQRRVLLSLLIGVVVPLLLWGIHTYYMPFDELARKVAGRIGLNL
ncbi:GumC family protein [Paenirhodobacter populi]|uniref:Lipopolysaccharide biosynthesis protein n=1 Tax=Paenirhodobacter populi TaxID=2306993 RepID=A0A443JBR2_9RHOB|nr:hypothetical protein [Sinirhodobacter populi]RWR17989.1 hypothetical protein D2T30_17245 [Sinirhodobacter populi]